MHQFSINSSAPRGARNPRDVRPGDWAAIRPSQTPVKSEVLPHSRRRTDSPDQCSGRRIL